MSQDTNHEEQHNKPIYETRPFWTYSLKYCNNPRRHVFGTLPCCYGLKIARGCVDARDFLFPPPAPYNPLLYHS